MAISNAFSLLDEENEDPQALASKAIKAAEQPKPKKEADAKAKEVAKPMGKNCSKYEAQSPLFTQSLPY